MKPINTALCSFGMSGWVFHAPFLKVNPGFNFCAVWERSKDLAAEKYPGVMTYRSLEALLADETVELVIVNTPNYTHFEYAKKALELLSNDSLYARVDCLLAGQDSYIMEVELFEPLLYLDTVTRRQKFIAALESKMLKQYRP